MKKLILILILFTSVSFAQKVKISGEVFDEYLVPFSGARVKTQSGKTTTTNRDGIFEMKVELPVQLKVSSDGFITEEVVVEKEGQHISLILKEGSQLNQVVLSASRTSERIFESPVSVSRLGLTDIKNTPSVNFYNALENIRGVNMYNGSMLYKMINTRGFTNMTNFRYVQLIDGVDNVFTQSDLSHGNAHGINELDVESVEILPGASSALYGPNAFNGVILMNSKSPFEYTGISVNLKGGVTTQGSGNKPFYAPSVRMAYKFDDTFAAKINFSLYQGDEWRANDYRDISTGKARKVNQRTPWYNGVNVYGDETQINMKLMAYEDIKWVKLTEEQVKKIPNVSMTGTGVEENYFTSNNVKSKKFDASLYYRPWGDKRLQIKWTSRFSLADYLYQVSNTRYTQQNSNYRQHLLEFRGESFYVRGYHTKTNLGDYYNHLLSGIEISNDAVSFFTGLRTYRDEFTKKFHEFKKNHTREEAVLLAAPYARESLNKKLYVKNGKRFNDVFGKIKTTLLDEKISSTAHARGTKSYGVSTLSQIDANFDFSKYIKFVDILMGGSYKKNVIDSKGLVFTDKPDDFIEVEQYGVYTQIKKNFDRLKLMGTLRYDESKNFEGRFSPRISANYVMGEDKNHNLRFSFQTAFRNPTLENQYVGMKTGPFSFVVGNLEENRRRFRYKNWNGIIDKALLEKTGFSLSSYNENIKSLNNILDDNDGAKEIEAKKEALAKKGVLKPYRFSDKKLKPENVSTFELGYRGLLNISNKIVEVDANVYYNRYKNFINQKESIIPLVGNADAKPNPAIKMGEDAPEDSYEKAVWALYDSKYIRVISPVNTSEEIQSYGFLATVKTKLFNDFDFGVTYNYSGYTFDKSIDSEFNAEFNTPKHSVKTMFGKRKLLGNFGFNVAHRWQSGYLWESQYGTADIEARSVFDAQVSYSIPSLKSRIKIGGNNIAGKEFYTALGTPTNGSIYYVSWIIND